MTKKICCFILLLLILSLLFLSSCDVGGGSRVIIAGSTSVQPYAEILAEAFSERDVEVQGGGSSAGIMAAESGVADIGMSSRHLKDSEKHLWSVEIAKDGLAIIVHPSNPIDDVTIDEIRDIYTLKISKWSILRGRDHEIHIIAREEGSGTRSAFEELAMGSERITPKAIVQNANGSVKQIVADDPNAIGFISMGLVDDTVKALKINGVEAVEMNVANGTYGLFRPFLFVAKSEPTGYAKEFVDFVLSNEGKSILAREGLVTGRVS